MRRTLWLSAILAGVLGIVAVAYAANTYKVDTAKVKPTNSGTLAKPKPERIDFGYSVASTDGNRPNVTTDYIIGFGPGIKQNSKLKSGSKFVFKQCKFAQATGSGCPSAAKLGGGKVKNKAGLEADPAQQIDCELKLTIFNGDGKVFPPSRNDGKSVKEDWWLVLTGGPPACPLTVNAVLPAQFTKYKGGLALAFHVTKIPLQEPQTGVKNAVVNTTSSIFKQAKVKGVFRGMFESTGCPKGGRPITVQFTDTSGAKFNAVKKAPCTK